MKLASLQLVSFSDNFFFCTHSASLNTRLLDNHAGDYDFLACTAVKRCLTFSTPVTSMFLIWIFRRSTQP